MDQPKASRQTPAQTEKEPEAAGKENDQSVTSPATDPTNPHNQEPTGDWVANEHASDRRNNEPGMTNREREGRKY